MPPQIRLVLDFLAQLPTDRLLDPEQSLNGIDHSDSDEMVSEGVSVEVKGGEERREGVDSFDGFDGDVFSLGEFHDVLESERRERKGQVHEAGEDERGE